MKAESIVFAVAGICFGVILGWIIGTQQAAKVETTPPPAAASAPATPQQPVLDEARLQGLMTIIQNDPGNAGAYAQLGNVYFDAERYQDAIKHYEQAVKLNPRDVNASTDLGVSYYYTNRPDDALRQFAHSLSVDPQHPKTLLNQGIVLAFGKNDLDAAAASWKKVVAVAPNSQEAQAAQRGLDGIAASRRGGQAAPAGS